MKNCFPCHEKESDPILSLLTMPLNAESSMVSATLTRGE